MSRQTLYQYLRTNE
ncbi:hypothetical protein ACET42_31080 [Pseudomonas aeruginosa]